MIQMIFYGQEHPLSPIDKRNESLIINRSGIYQNIHKLIDECDFIFKEYVEDNSKQMKSGRIPKNPLCNNLRLLHYELDDIHTQEKKERIKIIIFDRTNWDITNKILEYVDMNDFNVK